MKRFAALSIVLALGLSLALIGSLQAQSQAPAPAAPKAAEPKKAETKPAGGKSKDAKIQSAMSAAPRSISKDATVLDYPEKEGAEPAVLRKGANEWTCFPDDPSTPSNDPMCLDKNSMEWAQAWMGKKEPKLSGPGIGYMLQGGGSASNTDPFAKKPAAGEHWMKEAPHVMVFPNGKLDPKVYGTDAHKGGPWIMWAGTPYEHLMVPVK
jgi:hypothetical protein